MATSMDKYDRLGFWFGWIGAVWCIILFILLFLKAKEQSTRIKESHIATLTTKKDAIASLFFSFGCTLFTLLYCLFYGTVATDYGALFVKNVLNISMTQKSCQVTAQLMGNAGWQISGYCFNMFMLWRVKASFPESSESLRVKKCIFYLYCLYIHILLIFGLCIIIFWTKRDVTPDGYCVPVLAPVIPGSKLTTSDIRLIAWYLDFILTVFLLILFLKRLLQLLTKKMECYILKTVSLGILALLVSIILTLCRQYSESREWRYFGPLDLLIDVSCVVFTFNFNFNHCQRYRLFRVRSMDNGDESEMENANDKSDTNPYTQLIMTQMISITSTNLSAKIRNTHFPRFKLDINKYKEESELIFVILMKLIKNREIYSNQHIAQIISEYAATTYRKCIKCGREHGFVECHEDTFIINGALANYDELNDKIRFYLDCDPSWETNIGNNRNNYDQEIDIFCVECIKDWRCQLCGMQFLSLSHDTLLFVNGCDECQRNICEECMIQMDDHQTLCRDCCPYSSQNDPTTTSTSKSYKNYKSLPSKSSRLSRNGSSGNGSSRTKSSRTISSRTASSRTTSSRTRSLRTESSRYKPSSKQSLTNKSYNNSNNKSNNNASGWGSFGF